MINPIIKNIRQRVRGFNQNYLGIICGKTGSGKSFSALKLCETVDKTFNIDRVVFTPEELMRLISSNKLRKTHALLFDEAGVGYDARSWQSLNNRLLNHVVETFRNKNLILIMTTPSLDFIDLTCRKLFHGYYETVSINRVKKQCIVKPFIVSYSPRFKKTYYKYPVVVRDGRVVTINQLHFSLPSKALINAYEKKKQVFTNELNEDVLQSFKDARLKKEARERKAVDINDIARQVLKKQPSFVREYNKRRFVDKGLLRLEFGLTVAEAKLVKSLVEAKL